MPVFSKKRDEDLYRELSSIKDDLYKRSYSGFTGTEFAKLYPETFKLIESLRKHVAHAR